MFENRFAPLPPLDHHGRSAAARGYDRTWRQFRECYLANHPLCVFRDTPDLLHRCLVTASIPDHIKPLAEGGARLDESNLRSVCTACHSALTNNYRKTGQNQMASARGAVTK